MAHPSDRQRLRALAAYSEVLEGPALVSGVTERPGLLGGAIDKLPSVDLSEKTRDFTNMLYASGWILRFDWPSWQRTRRARQLFEDADALSKASAEDLARVLTVCVRRDRYVWGGSLNTDFQSGLMKRVADRARELADEEA